MNCTCEKIENNHLCFKDLRIGETFVLTYEDGGTEIDYPYVKLDRTNLPQGCTINAVGLEDGDCFSMEPNDFVRKLEGVFNYTVK